jgi:hypothetical protein
MKVMLLHTIIEELCTCEKADCKSPGKHPLTPNGLKDATVNKTTIHRWWTEASTANVGIVTGAESGIWMLGPDGPAGIEALARLEQEYGPLPPGPRSRSGGGGRHYIFRYDPNLPIKNAANLGGLPIDVRGEGGYVVAPPSKHESGGIYTWEVPLDDTLPPLAPQWLLQFLAADKNGVQSARSAGVGLTLRVQADDFRAAPGVKQGSRHKEACRLAGLHVGRSESQAAIEESALEWANRCDPPMPAEEVLRVVRDLFAKEAGRSKSIALQSVDSEVEDIDRLRLPEPPPWPVLDQAALYGIAGDIVRAIRPQTEADPVAILVQLLVMVGNIFGRGPHFLVEADRHCANLFACIVGTFSRARKGVSKGRSLALTGPADPEWAKHCVAHGLSSGEGLIWAVRDPIEKMEPIKEKGRVVSYETVVTDPGVKDKRLFIVESEFAGTLRTLRRENNTLSSTMREAWDLGDLRTLVKNNPARATGAHLSIVGQITQPELVRYLGETEMLNGFANRFLWILVRRSQLLPDGGCPVDLSGFVHRLTQSVQYARGVGQMSRTTTASQLWHRVYPELAAERPGLYGAITARAEAQVLRLSLVYALLDQRDRVDAHHLEAALALWRYCDESAWRIFGSPDQEADGDPLATKVLAIIRKNASGITRRGIYKATNGHIPARELVAALAKLQDKGLIRMEEIPTEGRPAETWIPQNGGCERRERSEQSAASLANCSLSSLCSQASPDDEGREVIPL